jgi:hypothetical protein
MVSREDFNKQWDEEGDLLKKVNEWLAPQIADGIVAVRVSDKYQKGYSDLFICVRGWWVLAELKDNTGTSSPHQDKFIAKFVRAGAVGGLCRSVADVSALIDEAKRRVNHFWEGEDA